MKRIISFILLALSIMTGFSATNYTKGWAEVRELIKKGNYRTAHEKAQTLFDAARTEQNMISTKKRLLSLILAITMVVSMFPHVSFAANNDEQQPQSGVTTEQKQDEKKDDAEPGEKKDDLAEAPEEGKKEDPQAEPAEKLDEKEPADNADV